MKGKQKLFRDKKKLKKRFSRITGSYRKSKEVKKLQKIVIKHLKTSYLITSQYSLLEIRIKIKRETETFEI